MIYLNELTKINNLLKKDKVYNSPHFLNKWENAHLYFNNICYDDNQYCEYCQEITQCGYYSGRIKYCYINNIITQQNKIITWVSECKLCNTTYHLKQWRKAMNERSFRRNIQI
jgi:hypothetical protein